MKLTQIILEQDGRPKVLIMGGGGGAGKSYVLDQVRIPSGVEIFNPDKYVEADNLHLSVAYRMVDAEVEKAKEERRNFVWDTTAANKQKVLDLMEAGYDVMMIMVYTHPIISFISNFQRDRKIPKAGVVSTWANVYSLVDDYEKLLGENFLLFVNLRGDKYNKEMEAFNKAAKKGGRGIYDYLNDMMSADPGAYASTFRTSYDIEDPEALKAYEEETKGIDFDRDDESLVKQLKKYFMTTYEKKGVGPGADRMAKKVDSIVTQRDKEADRYMGDLDKIADMLNSSKFQNMIDSDSIEDIKTKVEQFFK
jgi:hypothetical protein